MTYSVPIYTEQGGSVQRLESTGSLAVDQGAEVKFSADATPSNNTAYEIFKMGNNTFWYSASTASPVFSGSPGDLAWVPQSASTALWVNVSDGTTGSKWAAMNVANSDGSQVVGAR